MNKLKGWAVYIVVALHGFLLFAVYAWLQRNQKEMVQLKKKEVQNDLKEIRQGNQALPVSELIKRNNARFRSRN